MKKGRGSQISDRSHAFWFTDLGSYA